MKPFSTSPAFLGAEQNSGLVTDAIVISKLSEQEEADLSKLSKRVSFKTGGKAIRKSVWELKTRENLWIILPFLKNSYPYQAASK